MANEIKNYRSALAQNDWNKPMYRLMVIEVIIWSLVCALGVGYHFNSDMVTLTAFFVFIVVFTVMICLPDVKIIVFFFFGVGWATPLIALGKYIPAFYFLAFITFIMSFFVHYWASVYLADLSRSDDD